MDGMFLKDGYIVDCEEGEVFNYIAIAKDKKTGARKTFKKGARFVDHYAYLCCLDRWNRQGEHSTGKVQWIYKSCEN